MFSSLFCSTSTPRSGGEASGAIIDSRENPIDFAAVKRIEDELDA